MPFLGGNQAPYISQNWPILHVVASNDGMYLAVAGSHGLVLYDLRNRRWRVFGDVTQEQKIQCKGLLWLGKIVIVCNYVESSNMLVLFSYLFNSHFYFVTYNY
jgi:RAB6A-GEF complex partner protein 1